MGDSGFISPSDFPRAGEIIFESPLCFVETVCIGASVTFGMPYCNLRLVEGSTSQHWPGQYGRKLPRAVALNQGEGDLGS